MHSSEPNSAAGKMCVCHLTNPDIVLLCVGCRVVFMAAGMVAATLTHTAEACGIIAKAAPLAWPTSDVSNSGALLAAVSLLSMLGLARAAQAVSLYAAERTPPNIVICTRRFKPANVQKVVDWGRAGHVAHQGCRPGKAILKQRALTVTAGVFAVCAGIRAQASWVGGRACVWCPVCLWTRVHWYGAA